jgi:hypothetical protein
MATTISLANDGPQTLVPAGRWHFHITEAREGWSSGVINVTTAATISAVADQVARQVDLSAADELILTSEPAR